MGTGFEAALCSCGEEVLELSFILLSESGSAPWPEEGDLWLLGVVTSMGSATTEADVDMLYCVLRLRRLGGDKDVG